MIYTNSKFEFAFVVYEYEYVFEFAALYCPHRRMIKHRLCRQHCTESHGAYFKELQLLGRKMKMNTSIKSKSNKLNMYI